MDIYYACIVFICIFTFPGLKTMNQPLSTITKKPCISSKQGSMKDITIDYALRTTWQAVTRMYNEEASKFESTMATGFALLSIDPEEGTPSTSLGPRMGMEATSYHAP